MSCRAVQRFRKIPDHLRQLRVCRGHPSGLHSREQVRAHSGPEAAQLLLGRRSETLNRTCLRQIGPQVVMRCERRARYHQPFLSLRMGICRACIIYGCAECTTDGQDTCARCESGYSLSDKGTCISKNRYYWYALFGLLGLVAVFIVAWVVDICTRPIVNADGLKGALDYRSRSKVRMPKTGQTGQDDQGRELWPLDTNLLLQDVAGVGVTLQFNFQLFLILWSLAIAVGWLMLSLSVDDALLILGTRRAKTARQNCILVAWGFETQQRLMWTKIDFCVAAYVLTTVACVLFGIRQLRLFQKVDMTNSTHKDYAARIRNLPMMDGTAPVEEELKKRLEDATGQKIATASARASARLQRLHHHAHKLPLAASNSPHLAFMQV